MYLVPGGVLSPRGVYLVPVGVLSPGGCTYSQGVYLVPGFFLDYFSKPTPPPTDNERPVRILLECILVFQYLSVKMLPNYRVFAPNSRAGPFLPPSEKSWINH